MHPGNVRTALFNALLAWHHGGRFLVRVEDTDAGRSDRAAEESLLEGLRWLGLDWDEGPGRAVPAGGVRQSERGGVYADWYRRLLDGGHAYPCFCSAETLERTRRAQRAAGQPPRYPGTCAGIDPAEAARRVAAGEPAVLRLRVPAQRRIAFSDLVRGDQAVEADGLGDFVIRRADGTPSFLFCNAVDDALMGVTDVLRGEDHLANTPRQLLVLEALGLTPPRYGHLPLILGDDGAPLSKRNGSRSLEALRADGFLPAAVTNYLFRLGHSSRDDTLLDIAGMARVFDTARLGHAPARFDPVQLGHWQDEAVTVTPAQTLAAWLDADTPVPAAQREAFIELVRPNVRFPEEVREWAGRLFGVMPVGDVTVLREAGPDFFETAAAVYAEAGPDWRAFTAALRERTGRGGRRLFMPLRVALTGRGDGPALAEAARLMGPERVDGRLRAAARDAAGT
ncbi:Glutamate--tRNA ligase [wastewater metagenome]|uniref:Glutamate--tRNA ligase n=3 Tax=root TaxID=1 RepID=A0A5B8R9R7_9ZZZZ|nr:glutamate--tRNA ligase [uncultured organism]